MSRPEISIKHDQKSEICTDRGSYYIDYLMLSEIIFLVEDAPEGGLTAKALNIFYIYGSRRYGRIEK